MRDSLTIKDEKTQLKIRANEMIEACRKEIRMFTEDEEKEFNQIEKSIKGLNTELRELEKSLNTTPEEIREIKQVKKEIKMEKRFSLVNAIKSIANNQLMDDVSTAVANAGKEEMRKSGLSMGGQIQLPVEELRAAITVTAEGEDIVPTDLYNCLEPLRAKNVLVQAGARFLTGLVGDVQIPIMTASNVGWELETGAAKDGAGTFTSIKLTPHRLTAYIDLSKQLLAQDAIGVEQLIRQDIVNAINSKLEATILGDGDGMGTGSSATVQIAPKGIFNGKTPTLANTFAGIAELESTVEAANILGQCKYIMSPSAKAGLRSTGKSTNVTEAIYERGEIDGTSAFSTTNVAANQFVYGDFSNLVIGQWGPIDLTVDPFTQAVNGCVRLVINAYFDAKILRDAAFAFGKTKA